MSGRPVAGSAPVRATQSAPLRMAVLISGRGSNMVAIARACQDGRIHAHIVCVLSDRPSAEGLARARALGLDAHVIGEPGADRAAFEAALERELAAARADLIVLAGFMRVLSPELVQRHHGRMLNIHPSLLPRYKGLHTHRRVLQEGGREHGASVHFVTAELDDGPVISRARVPVRAGDTEQTLAERVRGQEHQIYPWTIGLMAAGRLQLRGESVWLDGQALTAPMEWSDEPRQGDSALPARI